MTSRLGRPVSSGKWLVRQLIEKAAGGEHRLTEEQFVKNFVPIASAVAEMREEYEGRQPDDAASTYYKECWRQIDQASTLTELLEALEYLRSSIQWQ